jgi:RHS repeat-associated protein
VAARGAIARYGYTGSKLDETGLIHYRARYYHPAIGRFTQRDPTGLAGRLNPDLGVRTIEGADPAASSLRVIDVSRSDGCPGPRTQRRSHRVLAGMHSAAARSPPCCALGKPLGACRSRT